MFNRKQIAAMWGGIIGVLVVFAFPVDTDGKLGERPYVVPVFFASNVDPDIRNFEISTVIVLTAALMITFGPRRP